MPPKKGDQENQDYGMGYLSVNRSIMGVRPGERKFTKEDAVRDLCFQASYKVRTIEIERDTIKIKIRLRVGELFISIRALAQRWGWARNTVRGFLRLLLELDFIEYWSVVTAQGTASKLTHPIDPPKTASINPLESRKIDPPETAKTNAVGITIKIIPYNNLTRFDFFELYREINPAGQKLTHPKKKKLTHPPLTHPIDPSLINIGKNKQEETHLGRKRKPSRKEQDDSGPLVLAGKKEKKKGGDFFRGRRQPESFTTMSKKEVEEIEQQLERSEKEGTLDPEEAKKIRAAIDRAWPWLADN